MPADSTDHDALVLFAGGGTGGHLYPTIAIAAHLADRLAPRARFRWLCSTRRIDESILRGEGVDFVAAPASPPGLRPRAMLRFLRGWGPSVRLAREQIRGARGQGRRVVLVASGGFVAAPLVQGARVERCPILMLNLDAVPGRANRWIARHATRILTTARLSDTAAPGAKRREWRPIPPIVRPGAVSAASPSECRREFGLAPDLLTLLVTGGSQGAASINRFLGTFVERHGEALRGWQVIHQTGATDDDVAWAYARGGVRAHVVEFLTKMGAAWGAADLCVCRAGAGNVAESWATRTPCLFMPYPFHKDAHQRANAIPLVEAGAGVLAHDAVDPRANLEEAGTALAELLQDAGARGRLGDALARLGPADGAAKAADAVVAMLNAS